MSTDNGHPPITRPEVIEIVKTRIAEIERERGILMGLLGYYADNPEHASPARIVPKPRVRVDMTLTDRIMQVVSDSPGLTWSGILRRATLGTDGLNRKSLSATIQYLTKRKKIENRGGLYYPASRTEVS